MDGAVYHGDPADRVLMRTNVAACERGVAQIQQIRSGAQHGPEKVFLIARILDRAATLSYMGLDDARTALREVRTAELYFRIATGLPNQSPEYRNAAAINARLTQIQLRTLYADVATRDAARKPAVASVAHRTKNRSRVTTAYTSYQRL